MPRLPQKFKSVGLRKTCKHLNPEKCACPWVARIPGHRYVNVSKWDGARTTLSRKQAEDLRNEMIVLQRQGKFNRKSRCKLLQGSSMSFADALDVYWAEEGSLLKGKTYKSYYDGWKAEFGKHSLIALSTDGVSEVERWLRQIQQESSTVNAHRWWEFGSRFFNWSKTKKRWSRESPMDLVSARIIGSGKARRRETRITPEMERKLLEVGPKLPDGDWLQRWLVGAMDLGIRRGEMLRVRVKDVNYEEWVVTLPKTKAQREQKVYAMTPRVQRLLESRRFLGADAYVFGTTSGNPVSEDQFQRRWKAWFRAAAIPVGLVGGLVWHDMRHEYVSHLLDQGVLVHEVKELARHSDIQTTMTYAKAKEDRLKEAARKMAIGRAG